MLLRASKRSIRCGVDGFTSHKAAYVNFFNVSEYISSDGSVAAHYEYDPFGNTTLTQGPLFAAFPFRYSTKYTDPESGFCYYGFRYLDPLTGQFPSRDPVGEDGGFMLYGFVRNNCITEWDYLGQVVFDTDGDRAGCCYASDIKNAIESDDELKLIVDQLSSRGNPPCLDRFTCDCSDSNFHCPECAENAAGVYSRSTGTIKICVNTMGNDGTILDITEVLRHELQHASQCGKYKGNCSGRSPTWDACVGLLKAEYEAYVCENSGSGPCSQAEIKKYGNGPCVQAVANDMTDGAHAPCPGCNNIELFNNNRTKDLINKIYRHTGENPYEWIKDLKDCYK